MSQCRPLWDQLVWDSLSFPSLYVFFLHQIREVLVIISSNRFLIPYSFSSPSGIPMMWMLLCFMLYKMFLSSPHFLKFFFFFLLLCLGVFSTLSSKSLILPFTSSNLLIIPSSVLLISFVISDWTFSLCLCFFSCCWVSL